MLKEQQKQMIGQQEELDKKQQKQRQNQIQQQKELLKLQYKNNFEMDVPLLDNLLDLMIPSEGDLLNDWGKHEEKLNTIRIDIETLRNNLNYKDNFDNFDFNNEINTLNLVLIDKK